MTDSTLDTFIEGIDPRFVPLVLAVDRSVLAAPPDFDTRITCKMLAHATIPADKKLYQRQIEATDEDIDALVYELYGLTQGEIAMLEGRER